MPRYLYKASYTAEGAKGVLKEGGSSRRAAISEMAEKAGGKVEAFYYAFGDCDVYVIAEAPDNASAASISLAVGASGAARIETVVLLTPEEIDQAAKASVAYRAPGT
jgi:uncharacterized protein with GYD domain